MADAERDPDRPLVTQLDREAGARPVSRTVIRPFEPNDPDGYADPEHPRTERIVARIRALSGAEFTRQLEKHLGLAGRQASRREASCCSAGSISASHCIERSGSDRRGSPPADRRLSQCRICVRGGGAVQSQHRHQPGSVGGGRCRATPPSSCRCAGSAKGICRRLPFVPGVWRADGVDPCRSAERDSRCRRSSPSRRAGPMATPSSSIAAAAEEPSETVLFPVTPTPEPRHRGPAADAVHHSGRAATPLPAPIPRLARAGIRQELIQTDDFRTFKLHPVTGDLAGGKGMALFPRQARRQMVSRSGDRTARTCGWRSRTTCSTGTSGNKILEPKDIRGRSSRSETADRRSRSTRAGCC